MTLLKVLAWVAVGPWTLIEGIAQGHIGMLLAGLLGTALWVEMVQVILP